MTKQLKLLFATALLSGATLAATDPGVTAWPTASELTYGQILQQSLLTGGAATAPGTFAFVQPSDQPAAGTASCDVVFTPDDNVTYDSVTNGVSVMVLRRTLTVSGATVSDKTYDRTTTATVSDEVLSGIVSGDSVSFAFFGGAFAQPGAGSDLDVYTYGALQGADAANYNVTYPVLSGAILKKTVTVSGAVAQDKAYDGTTGAVVSGATLVGAVLGDDVALSGAESGTFAQSNVGSGIVVSYSLSLSGSSAANYTLTQPGNLSADIFAANQVISDFLPAHSSSFAASDSVELSATASSALAVSYTVVSGPANISAGVNLSFSGAGTVLVEASQGGDGNWNAAPAVTNQYAVGKASASVVLSDLSYTYDAESHAATATTTPVGLSVDLTYDGSADLPVNAGTYEVIATINDAIYQGASTNQLEISKATTSVVLSNLSYTYDAGSHAATATTTPVGLSVDLTYDGSADLPVSAGTYAVVATVNEENYQGSASGTLVISKEVPTISGLSATDITYGQLLQQSILSGNSGGVAGAFTFVYFASMPDAGTISCDVAFTPTDSINYSSVTTSVSVAVAARTLYVSSVSAQNKVYDATTAATLSGGTLNNVVAGDDVSLINWAGTFGQASVGVALPVTSALSLTGTAASNYVLQQPTGLFGTISVKPLSVSGAVAQNKAYDGTTDALIGGATLVGVVGGDDVLLTDASSGTFAQSAVGTGIVVTTAMSLSGADRTNYTLAQPAGLVADITRVAQSVDSFLPTTGAELVVTSTQTLSATASSGLPVSFVLVSGPGVLDGASLSFSGVGTVLVAAQQAGDTNWDSVAQTNSYTIVHASPTIDLTTVERASSDAGIKILDQAILANCNDPEGSDLTISLTGSTSTNGGAVAMSGSWIFFTPKAGSDAVDRFEVQVSNAYGKQALGWVEVRVETPADASQSALRLQASGGNNTLTFLGIPGRAYTVQINTNIVEGVWETLRGVSADAGGVVQTVHTNAPSPCFYRLVD